MSSTVAENSAFEVLWEDSERSLRRILSDGAKGDRYAFMAGSSAAEHASPESINRLAHEHGLKDYIDGAWAVRPLELIRACGRTMLLVEYSGGERLDRLIRSPMEVGLFLQLAVALSAALKRLHGRGLIHKDIKPANVIVKSATGQVWLTGFGVATRLPARAPGTRTSRVHRRNARLYGARTNRTSEPLYRFPKRPGPER